jgi:hypothetical protein
LKVLKWPALRATVPTEAVVIEAPLPAPRAGIIKGDEHFARKAVIADTGYGALDAAFGVSSQLHLRQAEHLKRFGLRIPSIRCEAASSN